ncbi:DUF11 domain-containing protein [Bacillus sp. E(2018)]|uniref:DUF11 domain-containing protein n=1 Tax=Bacillus sp. E(2018) TaxID=2502239 RepID=UPI0010F8CDD7|nr:DUF11 domain-containing protein [Bacillus sp. E(2018)]
MPYVQRFTTTTNGSMTFTGNTLGLSKLQNTLNAGQQDSIGAFISLQNTGVATYPPPPPGTTQDFNQSSSSAILDINNISRLSSVLYAELIWQGQYLSSNQSVEPFIDDPINFTDPSGNLYSITPDPSTSFNQVFDSGGITVGYYVRSREVTDIVASQLGGTYSAGGVPAVLDPASNSNHAGWTLAVVYEDPTQNARFMTLYVGLQAIIAGGSPVDFTLTGFNTPVSGPLVGRLLVSAGEGDATLTGDQLQFGPTVGTLIPLSGPNNPVSNFFGSQINDDSGNLDSTGTFGDRNQNPFTATNIVAGRQGWDITNVDASAELVNNQTSAVVRLTTVGDGYAVNALGVQFDINAPTFETVKSATPTNARVGDTITYNITVTNTGLVPAEIVLFSDNLLTPGSTFVPGSLQIDNVPSPIDPTTTPISLGTINPQDSITISFQSKVTSIPPQNTLSDVTELNFQYQSTPGGPIFSGTNASNVAQVTISQPPPPPPPPPFIPNIFNKCSKDKKAEFDHGDDFCESSSSFY